MAMEMFVLSDKQLSSIKDWQSAIDAERYPLQLEDEIPIEGLKGFLPARLRDHQTGFECAHWPAEEFMREVPQVNFGHDWKYVLAFRWIGDFNELQAAWMAGTAYASATDGVVFDDWEGKIRTPDEARQVVQEIQRDMPRVEAIVRELRRS